MTPERSHSWVVAEYPDGVPGASDFDLVETDLPDLGDGDLLVRNTLISVDAGVRSRLNRDSYRPQARIGEVVDGFCVGTVEASNNPKFTVGDRVSSGVGWQEHYVSNGRGLLRLDEAIFSPPITDGAAIGVLGVSGLTAYFGTLRLGEPVEGETVLVSSAAGTVGATAGQIARIAGCRVVGIAGGPAKGSYVTDELRFDECIDYKAVDDLAGAVSDACPDGVDVYFDNVGGATLDAAIVNMNTRGRIAMVGQLAEYNEPEPRGAHQVLEFVERRLRMQGMVVFDFLREFKGAMAEIAGWIRSGDLVYREEIIDGFENLPTAFSGLFTGDTLGRRLVRVI